MGKGCRKAGFVLVLLLTEQLEFVFFFFFLSEITKSELECSLSENGKLPGYSKLVVLKRCYKSARSQSCGSELHVQHSVCPLAKSSKGTAC